MNNYYSLEKAILNTICYFDVFDFPLTPLEIGKWLFFNQKKSEDIENHKNSKIDLPAVLNTLEESVNLKKTIESKKGFFFLRGKEGNIKLRLDHYQLAEKKYQKALKVAKIFRFFPFLKMIGICNSLAFSNAREKSDIDFFIITTFKRIWTIRFFTTSFLKLFRLRPTKTKVENKICLSFFISTSEEQNENKFSFSSSEVSSGGGSAFGGETQGKYPAACRASFRAKRMDPELTLGSIPFITRNNLNLKRLQLTDQDPYFSFWISQVLPIYDPENIYLEFWKENRWIKDYLPTSLPNSPVSRRKISDNFITFFLKKTLEFLLKGIFGDFVEKSLKKIQLKILPKKLKEMANQDSRVIIQDTILKFHDNDRRKEFEFLFQQRLQSIINK